MSAQEQKKEHWYDYKRAAEVVDAYNRGAGSAQPADAFVAQSVLPAGTAGERDFSYIAPELPEFNSANCVGCMDCVNNCPDTAILGKIVKPEDLEKELVNVTDASHKEYLREQFATQVKYHGQFEGAVPKVDTGAARRNFRSVSKAIKTGLVRSCHDLA